MNIFRKVGTAIFFMALIGLVSACESDFLPKPKAQLRLEYPESKYILLDENCPYSFEVASLTEVKANSKCWLNVEYPELKASINMTYRPVEGNLKELFVEAEKLTFNHTIKADAIASRPYEDAKRSVYGAIFEVSGNAASPLQFHATDSLNHFVTGAVYFEVQPNYDSIRPAIHHLEKDVIRIIETLKWKN